MERIQIIKVVGLLFSCSILKSVFAITSVDRCRQNSSDTKFVKNGYEGLVVVVGDDVEQDYSLIEDLRKLLTATSEKMFQVTKRRAYIRQVSVLLPRAWGVPPKEFEDILEVKTDTVHSNNDRGDFRLQNRSPRSDGEDVSWQLGEEEAQVDMPYVIKPTPCGYSGRYLRLTPEFVRFGGKAADTGSMARPEKILVRQWAKLRWGVYDEVPLDDAESNFYRHTDLKVHPVACSTAITGKIIKEGNPEVTCSEEEALVNVNCTFKPDDTPNVEESRKINLDESIGITGYASLMYSPNLDYVDHFCDTEEESEQEIPVEQQHNAEAPTIHNLHCQGKSVWEVIRTHPDFVKGNNPPLPEDFSPPPLQFSLLKNPDRRIVLVLDISTSMRDFNRLKLMRQAASQFIETVPENSWIGIVTFAAEGTVMSELIRVSSNDVRRLLKERLPSFLVPGTSIGSGIKLALKVLKTSGPKHMRKSGGSMLVLSDGKEHNSPKINDTLLDVIDFGVRVTTIAFGAKVAEDLDVLADVTGGSAYFASSGKFSDNSELRDAFLATIENSEDDMVVVSSQSVRLKANSSEGHTFIIDETIGRETRITVLYTDTVPPKVGLQNPWGEVVWEDDDMTFDTNITAEFSADEDFSTKTIQYFGYMEPGIWTLLLKNQRLQDAVTADISVFSHPAEEEESLVLSPALLCRIINYSGSESIVIYAHLSFGEFAVLDAEVEAIVTRPLSLSGSYDTATVSLRDDGRGADVIANDGIYSGYFTRFTLQGRYNVKVNAGDGGAARLDINHILGLGRRTNDLVTVSTKDLLQKIGNKRERKGKSRKRRAIRKISRRMGKLKAFKRWSTQQKEFIVNDTTAIVCPDGYNHFQDSCYKYVRLAMASFSDASTYCANEGGYLAHVNSNQELLYIMDAIGGTDSWFGGIHQSLNRDEISVEFVTKRIKRGNEDEDLVVLANLFNRYYLNENVRKAIESFEPDLKGLSRKEINRIIRALGGTSESDIPLLKEAKLAQGLRDILTTAYLLPFTTHHATTTESYRRRRRQADTLPTSSGDENIETTAVFTTLPTYTENATLALAKKYPDQKDYFGSGESDPECSWFNDGKIAETSGDEVCSRKKAFFCERPKIDLFEPSRITDLKVKKTSDPAIVKLIWTATGDDKTNGRAKEYEVRNLRTKRARKLARSFRDGEILRYAAILNGTVDTAKISGEREELLINLTAMSGCPPHAAIDLIILLPRRLLTPSSGLNREKESTLDLFTTLFSMFKISVYEIQVSIIAVEDQGGRVLLRESSSATEVLESITQGLEQDNIQGQAIKYHDILKILDDMNSRGRAITPKVMLSILADDDMETLTSFQNITELTKIIVGVGIKNESDFRAVASAPGCRNAIFAPTWNDLNKTSGDIASQLCYARNDEYQAWGIVAVDEGGLRSEPSNIASNIIFNRKEVVDCPPEPIPPQPNVAGLDITTVTIAITIPLAVILGIVGAVICFGQVKKYRKKKREKKERKEREAEEAAAEARRAEAMKNARIRGNVRANMVGLLQNVRKNSNLKLKINKTAPVSQPPV